MQDVQQLQKYHHPGASKYQHKFGHFKDNAKIRIEQNNDPVLRNLRNIVKKQKFDENEFKSDARYGHYQQNLQRTEVHNNVLERRYYDDTVRISHYQIYLPQQLLNELLHSRHGQSAKQPGTTKTIQKARQKYYYPCLAKHIKNWVSQCQECVQNKRINNTQINPELLSCLNWGLGPKDALQMDIL